MKKMVLVFATIALFISTSAFAGSCNIPKFLKKGVTIHTLYSSGIIVEIDKKSCWIKLEKTGKSNKDYDGWININAITHIKPK